MAYQREHKPSSWNPPTQQKSSQFDSRPFGIQAQPKSNRPPTQTEIENEAFQQHKFEAFGLQLKQESGTITPEETERLGVLQAKMDEFWAQRRARTQGQPNLLEILSKNAGETPATEPATPIQHSQSHSPNISSIQAIGSYVQRQTIDEHLNEVQKNAKNWDETYQEDFNNIHELVLDLISKVTYEPKWINTKSYGQQMKGFNLVNVTEDGITVNSDAFSDNWRDYIQFLINSNMISKTTGDVYWYCLGKGEKPGRGGINDLNFKDGTIVGRPSFHSETQDKIKTPKKFHRRHIVAWHTIREFANKVYDTMPNDLEEILGLLLKELEKFNLYGFAKEKVENLRLNNGSQEKLLIALFIMNSNPANLWSGEGKENSGINTASMTIRKEMEKWGSILTMFATLDKWNIQKLNQKTITDKVKAKIFAFVINLINKNENFKLKREFGTKLTQINIEFENPELKKLYQSWHSKKNSIDEKSLSKIELGIVNDIRSNITEWIISNLEFDAGFQEADTHEVLSNHNRQDIIEVIPIFFKTVFQDQKVSKEEANNAFSALLSLPKNFFSEK